MNPAEAHRIIQALADGRDPFGGERLPEHLVYQHPDVIRALFAAAQSLERTIQRAEIRSSGPANQGKPWTELEDEQLCTGHDAGASISTLAELHQRSRGG